jgi:creatinine amidohydrolase
MAEELYTVVGPKSWSMMTSWELAEKLKVTNVALMQVGAVEQHGSHLPLGADNYQTEELIRRAILKLDKKGFKAIFGPTIPFGPISNIRFPGSLDIKPTTLVVLIKEICMNLYRDGVRKIVLVLGHDMNLGAMMVAARELSAETADQLQVVVLNWMPVLLNLLPGMFNDIPAGMREGLGGAGQTSRMLALYPKLVLTENYRDYLAEAHDPPDPFSGPLVAGGGVYAPLKVSNHDPQFRGHVGFPRLASVEAGEKLFEAISSWIADVTGEYCFGNDSKAYNY